MLIVAVARERDDAGADGAALRGDVVVVDFLCRREGRGGGEGEGEEERGEEHVWVMGWK